MKNNEILDLITNPKKQKSFFRRKLSQYNKPVFNVIIGFISTVFVGVISAMFGPLIVLNVFSMFKPVD